MPVYPVLHLGALEGIISSLSELNQNLESERSEEVI